MGRKQRTSIANLDYIFCFDIAIIQYLEYKYIHGGTFMDYMTAKEAAEKWQITQRRVAVIYYSIK